MKRLAPSLWRNAPWLKLDSRRRMRKMEHSAEFGRIPFQPAKTIFMNCILKTLSRGAGAQNRGPPRTDKRKPPKTEVYGGGVYWVYDDEKCS
jgi:hypothetical protein